METAFNILDAVTPNDRSSVAGVAWIIGFAVIGTLVFFVLPVFLGPDLSLRRRLPRQDEAE